ncbi:MAG: extracellular solute-binding protein, partial [Acutalibacter sp.]|nr:extracellular solute-binding protein [Acutalibacter sp.]
MDIFKRIIYIKQILAVKYMKHRHLISLILTILFLAAAVPGCGPAETDEKPESSAPSSVESKAQSAPAPSPTPEPTPYVDPEGLTGQLTLLHFTSTGTSEQLDAMAEEFMEIHPGVTIKTEYGVDSDTLTAENGDELRAVYDDRVRAELENGEADYILVNVPDSLPVRRLTRDNLLLDLTSYWENDASIDPADYFTSVLDAYSIDGKLPVFPLDFCFMGAYLNRPLMEQLQVDVDAVDSIDFNMLMEWYKAGCQLQPDLQFSFGGWMQENIFSMERSAYMDIETGTASFLSPAFLEFLNTTGSIEE